MEVKQFRMPDGSIVNLPGGSKEWQLFQTVTGDSNTGFFEYTNLDFTELYFIATGLYNISSETTSGVYIEINGIQEGLLDTQKSNGKSDTKNQTLHLKFNGLFWETLKTQPSNNAESYYNLFGNATVPYSNNVGTEKCTKLKFNSNLNYRWAGGTIKIYAR